MSGEIALRGASGTALELPANLSFEDWEGTGRVLARIEKACMWWIGDWWRYGDHAYGERAAQVLDSDTFAFQTWANAGWVAGSVETSRRREGLKFGHHAEVAADEPADQDYWLDQAEEHEWTVRELRRARRPQPPPPPVGTFSILYADPPWEYDFSLTDSRQVENQYPTLSVEEIENLKLPEIAPDAVLFLWATAPKLLEALAVLDSWGFTYKTNAVWDKMKLGMGYWFRGRHELLLVGTRGKFSPPQEEERVPSVLNGDRANHSQKPIEVAEWIESWWPELPKVELFARKQREGWTSWGNEA